MWILGGALRVVGRAVPVVAPLPDVTVHVVEAPAIGPLPADRLRLALRMRLEPGVLRQLAVGVAEAVFPGAAGAAGVLPLRLGRQPVAVGVEVALPGGQVVAGGQPVELRAAVAEADGVGPLRPLDGVLRRLPLRRVDAHHLLIEFLRHRVLVEVKRGDADAVRRLVVAAGGVAHREAAGRDQDQRAARARLEDGKGFLAGRLGRGRAGAVPGAAGSHERGCHPCECHDPGHQGSSSP